MMSTFLGIPWFRRPLTRRLTFACAAVILAGLCVWPQHYLAKTEIGWEDSGGGLTSILNGQAGGGGLLSLTSLLGSHQSIEADLTIARSEAVRRGVIAKLRLERRKGFGGGVEHASLKLKHLVDIEALRGSILEVKAKNADPDFAKIIVAAYAEAIKDRLNEIARQEAIEKRRITNAGLADASVRMAQAQAALTQFRAENKLGAPEQQVSASATLLAVLQGQLEGKEAELQGLRRFATEGSFQVQALEAQIAGLQGQISEAQTRSTGPDGSPTLAGMSLKAAQYTNLYRDEKAAETLYEGYRRYLIQIQVDESSATTNMDIIEPAVVDPARQYNIWAVALLGLVLMVAVASELYLLSPPVGER
jgi:uncharacterized protein involved in exopolysaccharide biosynthesis